MTNTCAKVRYEGHVYSLEQAAYRDWDERYGDHYAARAVSSDGRYCYRVVWKLRDDYNEGRDPDYVACDWSKPIAVIPI